MLFRSKKWEYRSQAKWSMSGIPKFVIQQEGNSTLYMSVQVEYNPNTREFKYTYPKIESELKQCQEYYNEVL